MLRRRRMMQKFRGITFDDSIDIVNPELMLIDQQPVGGRFALEKCDRPFDAKNPANERSDQERDDSEVGNEKRAVIFFPRPA